MRQQSARPDQVIARIAARQYGVVDFNQLVAAGVSASAVARRVRSGGLHRLHRGVYAVGHTSLSDEGRWLAAVRACGRDAVLSHQSAAALWGISPTRTPLVHVTIPTHNGRRPQRGIRLHRSSTLGSEDVTVRRAIPVTTHARTLSDLKLGSEPTASELERLFLRLCRRAGLPTPAVNARLGAYTVDFLWRDQRLVVETDGFEHHSSRTSFEADRARDVQLGVRGYRVHRFTYRQLSREPATVVASLRTLLRRSGGAGQS